MRLAAPLAALLLVVALPACKKDAPSAPLPGPAPVAAPAATVNEAPATAACSWSAEHADVANWRTLVQADDPSFGPADAKVTVVEFFEPNCPFCARLAPTMAKVQETHPDVRFVYKPVVFWPVSSLQAQALSAAHADGKFLPFLAEQFRQHSEQTGLTDAQVRAIAAQVGMDPEATMQRINTGTYRAKMLANRADFAGTGNDAVPLVLINGKVMGKEQSTGCFDQLLAEQAGT